MCYSHSFPLKSRSSAADHYTFGALSNIYISRTVYILTQNKPHHNEDTLDNNQKGS